MTIDWMRRSLAVLMIGLFVGALGACEEQSSTEQTSETTGTGADQADEATSGTETTN